MENKKSNKSLYVVIVILFFLVLSVVSYLVYDKVFEKDSVDLNSDNSYINTEGNNDIGNKWMNYIMNTNLNSIKLNYCEDEVVDDNGFPIQKTINITENDLDKIFSEMKKGSVYKDYHGGLGGPCMGGIKIDYTTTGGKKFQLDLVLYKLIVFEYTKDSEILSSLENTKYTVKEYNNNIDLNSEPYMFEYSYNEDVIKTIIDSYTK